MNPKAQRPAPQHPAAAVLLRQPACSQIQPVSSRVRPFRSWMTLWSTAHPAIKLLCCLSSRRTAVRLIEAARATTDALRHLPSGQNCQGARRAHRPHREDPAVPAGLLPACHCQLPHRRHGHRSIRAAALQPQQLHPHRYCRLRRVLCQAQLVRRARHRAQRIGSSSTCSAGASSMRVLS